MSEYENRINRLFRAAKLRLRRGHDDGCAKVIAWKLQREATCNCGQGPLEAALAELAPRVLLAPFAPPLAPSDAGRECAACKQLWPTSPTSHSGHSTCEDGWFCSPECLRFPDR